MTEEELDIRVQIMIVLRCEWNPFRRNKPLLDRLDKYADMVYHWKIGGTHKSELGFFLNYMEYTDMGLKGNIIHCIRIAQMIIDIKSSVPQNIRLNTDV